MDNQGVVTAPASSAPPAPTLTRSIQLDFVGDWGQATFHRILSWLTQEVCDRAGPESRTRIWSIRGGGVEALPMVHSGEADLCVATPSQLMRGALTGEGIFAPYGPMPHLRALAVLPQRDRMILVVHPTLNVRSFSDIRKHKPTLKIAMSADEGGTSFIGHVSTTLLEAHGLSRANVESWEGTFIGFKRPQQCFAAALNGTANAVIQEAIMLPEWNEMVDRQGWIPIEVDADALQKLSDRAGFKPATLHKGFWEKLDRDLTALEFSDFLIVVRDDMPKDLARLLTWCLVHTRATIERQFKHIPADKCALTYPLQPAEMAKTTLELHPGAKEVYAEIGVL
ncbi:hypothetical protein H2200_005942 [Cladophialophora chaetospira]|uniref:Uncharacterized protein n=1 Tax=Cladophialophora chaetospira TaxID=386627 RepID=A0AA39CIN1_9EURO|nr:hypothetical protein H2200_005942 [Cladophialophora chaetospira]